MSSQSEFNDNGSSPASDATAETERDPRRRAFKAGIVSYQNHTITVDCIIRDTNSGGVKLKFQENAMVPDRFMLTIPIEGKKVDCQTVWRKDREIGVEFISEIQVDQRNLRAQSIDLKYIMPRKSTIRRT